MRVVVPFVVVVVVMVVVVTGLLGLGLDDGRRRDRSFHHVRLGRFLLAEQLREKAHSVAPQAGGNTGTKNARSGEPEGLPDLTRRIYFTGGRRVKHKNSADCEHFCHNLANTCSSGRTAPYAS